MVYYLLYKPYGMLSQFSLPLDFAPHKTLADLPYRFAKDVYPIGRLDEDSEGLLLLSNDRQLNHKLLDPKWQHPRTYCVQVEGMPTPEALAQLRTGVTIRVKGKIYQTLPAKADHLLEQPLLPARNPPVRYRAYIPTSWLSLTLIEGKNRQVRRMTAAVGLPTLRLVRVAIGSLLMPEGMKAAECLTLTREEVYNALFAE